MLTKRGVSVLSSTLGLVAGSSIAFDALFSTITLFVLSVLGIESLLYLRSVRRLSLLRAERKVPFRTAFVGDKFSIKTSLRNAGGSRTGPLLITERIPHGFRVEGMQEEWIERLDGGASHPISYTLEALQMGDWDLGDLEAMVTDRFGIFKKVRRIKVESKVRVFPSMRKGEELLRGRIHLGLKSIRRSTVTTPQGSEFSGIREYAPGDDYRLIAWKAMARSPVQAPKTKEHENEQALNVTLVIANSETSGEGFVGRRKIDLAAESAIVLAHISVKTGGRFSLVVWKRGRAELIRGKPLEIASSIFDMSPEPELDLESMMNLAIRASQERSLILVLLDSPYPRKIDSAPLRRVSFKGHFLHAMLLDTASFLLYHGEDHTIKSAEGIIAEREHLHLRTLSADLASDSISSQICTEVALLTQVVDVFSTSAILLEA